ncbi:TIGR01244 family sulfur transferase, partial [Acinetobacter baumannii]
QITELDVRTFANHYNELPKPVLMFCRTGNRSNNLYQLAKQMDLLDD